MFMRGMHSAGKKSFLLLVSLAALLTFVLTSCVGTGSGTGPTLTSTPTSVQGFGTAHGCPSDTVVTSALPAANVTIKMSDANALITARVGDVLEIQLPFGLRWTGPKITGDGLHLYTPAGYASTVLGISLFCLQVSTSALNEAGCIGKHHNHTTMRVSREPGSQA